MSLRLPTLVGGEAISSPRRDYLRMGTIPPESVHLSVYLSGAQSLCTREVHRGDLLISPLKGDLLLAGGDRGVFCNTTGLLRRPANSGLLAPTSLTFVRTKI